MRWRASRRGADDFDFESLAAPAPAAVPMENAGTDGIKAVDKDFGLRIRAGIRIKWDKDTPNPKPAGLCRDGTGRWTVFACFFRAN